MESGKQGPVTDAVDVYALGKVLYWMLSGGHIFGREDHRAENLYLPHVLGEGKWEHVHALLDGMITPDWKERIAIQLLPTRFELTRYLVHGNLMPLRPSMGLTCRVCGIGRYERYARTGRSPESPPSAAWLRHTISNAAGRPEVAVLRCNHCGHVVWFDLEGIADRDWWDR